MTTLLAALAALTAVAQSNGRIYIDDFDIAADSTAIVQVMLANPDPTLGLQFKMTVPDGLRVDEMELTKYSDRLKMNLANKLKGSTWSVAVYSMSLMPYPSDTAAVMTLKLTALPGFAGGDISIYRSQGSTEDFTTIHYDDSRAAVTLRPGTH